MSSLQCERWASHDPRGRFWGPRIIFYFSVLIVCIKFIQSEKKVRYALLKLLTPSTAADATHAPAGAAHAPPLLASLGITPGLPLDHPHSAIQPILLVHPHSAFLSQLPPWMFLDNLPSPPRGWPGTALPLALSIMSWPRWICLDKPHASPGGGGGSART